MICSTEELPVRTGGKQNAEQVTGECRNNYPIADSVMINNRDYDDFLINSGDYNHAEVMLN